MVELAEQQRQELSHLEPIVIDPQTKETYVLVKSKTYSKMKALLAIYDFDPDEGMILMNEVMADDDAHDPLLENYQRFGKQG